MTKVLPADVEKEIRALAMPWLASAAAIVLGASGAPLIRGFENAAYFLGVSALGGLAMGQEYSYGTLGTFLALPVRRERMLIVKWTVLAILLLALDVVMWVSSAELRAFGSHRATLPLVALPTLCALFIAPWLTMWSRSALAGAVLAGGLPGTVFVFTQLIIYWVTGDVLNEIDVLVRVTPVVCAVGAIMSWRMFMRLEAIEGGGRDLRLPAWSSAGADIVTRRSPVWLLVKKEVALQQISLVLGAGPVFGWLAWMVLRDRVEHMDAIFNIMTVPYAILLALIVGTTASAEERQLGTHEWQQLLPMPASRQWQVKVVVALALGIFLSLVVPTPLLYFINGKAAVLPIIVPSFVVGSVIVTTLGLYFSSLSTSGLRALVLAVPAIGLGMLPGARLGAAEGVARVVYGSWHWLIYQAGYFSFSYEARYRISGGFKLILATLFIAIVLRFALANHRTSAPIGRHLWWQGLVIGLCLSTAAFIFTVGTMFFGMI
jgi:hypothetical protein